MINDYINYYANKYAKFISKKSCGYFTIAINCLTENILRKIRGS